MNTSALKREWFSNVKGDLLAGTVVALALIPEAIAFSIIAGVDPKVGLYSSFCIAVVTAFVGGRPGLISAATGAMALLMKGLYDPVNGVGPDGSTTLDYLLAVSIATGILQIIFGWLKLGNQMKFVPRAVMVGFVNALAILIFQAQLPQLNPQIVPWQVYPLVAFSLGIIYLLPLVTKLVPSPLVAIVVTTLVTRGLNLDVPTVGDMGNLPSNLPSFIIPSIPLSLESLKFVLSFALPLSIVGLMESLLTASLLDELTDTPSDKNREAKGQGIGNIVAGFFGGMAGCAMIGQSVINIQSGGRKRLSTFWAGIFLLILILVFRAWVKEIPMAALVAVMIMVSIGTFNWGSLRNLQLIPRSETVAMVTTVMITIYTHNLAIGVMIGIALSTVFFSQKIAEVIMVDQVQHDDPNHRIYSVGGQLFFLSVDEFLGQFDFTEELEKVTIDLTHAHLWDQAAVGAIDKVVIKFNRKGAEVELIGLNQASETLLNKLATHNDPEATSGAGSH